PNVLAREVTAGKDHFAIGLRIARCGGKVEQWVAVASLPDAPVLYLERLVARSDVEVMEVATGTAPILNEDAPGIAPNRRVVAHAAGTETIVGLSRQPPRLLRWKTGWANVDGKLGVLCTTGAMAWRDRDAYWHSRLEEELVANYHTGIGEVATDVEIGRCAALFIPNQAAEATAASKLALEASGTLLAARFGETVVVANLGSDPAEARLFGRSVALKPLRTAILAAR
ncbi:MAG: hypothetical protein ACODAJ_13370, partial [Planctomycetota bacterium]